MTPKTSQSTLLPLEQRPGPGLARPGRPARYACWPAYGSSFSLGIWRIAEGRCLELLDCGRLFGPVWDCADGASRVFDRAELVQHCPGHLDLLLALGSMDIPATADDL